MNFEGLIPIVGGMIMILFANGTFPKNPKDPEKMKKRRKKYRPVVKILGPLVVLFGVLQLIGILG